MKIKFLSFLMCFLYYTFSNVVYAQNIQINGTVKNKTNGEPISGASVVIEKTQKGIATDINGSFKLEVPNGSVLVISNVGYTTQKITVNKAESIIILLVEDKSSLGEIVVVGYGSQKVTKVSGAISTVKSADIEKLKPTRTEEALQGKASGVNVIQSGTPGSKPTVLIRGIPSYSGTDPVVIIDGVVQTLTDFNSLNPADIETINVLKDAAGTAIYGVKGGNGVIVVTTKGGKKNQKVELNFNSNYGIQDVIQTVPVLNASEYAAIINEGSTLSGGSIIFPNLSTIGVGRNWQNEVFKTAAIQNHSISAKGGSDKMSYFLSGGYLSQGGIVGGNDKSVFTRGNITANLIFDLSSKLKFILNTSGVILNSKGIQENSFNSVLGSAINYDPTVTYYNTNSDVTSKYGYSKLLLSEIYNPITKLDNTYNTTNGFKLYGKAELQYDVVKNLKLTARFGYTKYDGNAKSFNPLVFWGENNVDNTLNADGSTVAGKHNSVSSEKSSNFNYTVEGFANYNFSIGSKNHFETVVGLAYTKVTGNAAGVSRQDVPFNSWEFADVNAATGTNTATNTNALTGYYYQYFRKNISSFARINYDYDDRYLASLTIRRDGSYAFGNNNKFGNFLAGSLGWVVSSEKFFKSKHIDFLKIRGSYGTTGNENVNPQYVSIATGGPSYGSTGNSNGYTFGDVFYPGSTVASASNNSLRWEKQIQANIGFEAFLFKRKLNINADYFEKKVDGLLFTPSASLYLGTVPIPTANIGTTKSSGFELTIGYNETFGKNFKLNTSITYTAVKNQVTATNDDGTAKIFGGYYFNGQSQSVTVFEKGYTPGYFYGYKTDGLFQNQKDIASSATQTGAQPGDIKFVDVNGDGKITDADKTYIGNPFPKTTIGWTLGFEYKSFDFNVFTYFSIGNDVYRAYERNANYTNKYRSVLARWTNDGSTNDAKTPRYTFDDKNSNIRVSDRYVEDGSFIKVKNIQIGYTFNQKFMKKIFNKVRVYAQVKNAFVFTKYDGFDPEISGGILDSGIDRGAYPQPRTFAFGLDIKF